LPGFIDSHTHVGLFGVDHLRSVDCDLRSLADIQRAIRERASHTPKGEWIRGFKYDDTKTVEGRKPAKRTSQVGRLAGWQVGIHANGDVAIDIALRVYERLSREHARPNARFRVEHCTLINDDLLKRIKALDVIPTPFWTYVYYHGEKMKYYGPERLD
jgi:predicted amidohydrolase YtcJ